jgi:hypothetical protein
VVINLFHKLIHGPLLFDNKFTIYYLIIVTIIINILIIYCDGDEAANIVVIFDPSWNVTLDLQAQDRAYRIGQKKYTKIFRFISAGTELN